MTVYGSVSADGNYAGVWPLAVLPMTARTTYDRVLRTLFGETPTVSRNSAFRSSAPLQAEEKKGKQNQQGGVSSENGGKPIWKGSLKEISASVNYIA
ncbi:unnamed protein product [Calicophoron daubneyi]|uniref:Uncharacterized protein n=1 Tax=Calicophoron daubneyi TaxID=300641 RepID=A0AAV2T3K9_CALDB